MPSSHPPDTADTPESDPLPAPRASVQNALQTAQRTERRSRSSSVSSCGSEDPQSGGFVVSSAYKAPFVSGFSFGNKNPNSRGEPFASLETRRLLYEFPWKVSAETTAKRFRSTPIRRFHGTSAL